MNTFVIFSISLLTGLLALACYLLWKKVRVQEKLLKQDESLQSLFENQNEAWVIFDAESLLAIRANQKALNLFGLYRLRRIDQLSFKNIFREPLGDDDVQLLYSAIDQEAFVNRKLQCSGVSGRTFNALVSITRVYEGNLFCRFAEEPVRFELKIVPTLTERTTTVTREEKSNHFPVENVHLPVTAPVQPVMHEPSAVMTLSGSEQWKSIGDVPLVWINISQAIVMANDAFALLTGYEKSELVKLHFYDLAHPVSSITSQQLDELTKGNLLYYSEERTLLRRNSKKIIVRCQGMLTSEKGIALLTLEDVTEQKTIEKELLFTRDNLQAVVEHTSEAIFSVDALDKIMVVNTVYRDRFFEKYGVWLKQGMSYGEALPKEERTAWRKTLSEVLRGKISTFREQFSNISGGREEYYEVSLHPVYSGVHKLITGLSYFASNVTAQTAYEKELQEARSTAEKATEAKSRFLATMSHEIRTPLNGLIGMTELMRTTRLDDEQQNLLSKIRVSGDALLQVINEVLDYSRIEADKMHLESAPFKVEKVINETIDILSYKTTEKNLLLEKEIASSVPAVVVGDKARLRQVLVNLVGNALKFTPSGFVKISAVSQKFRDKEGILFSVEDSGIGMTAEETNRLFNEFEQADTTTYGKFGGSGLGLIISKRIVELMGGIIGVESEKGKGSRFYFHIPVTEGVMPQTDLDQQAFEVDTNLSNRYPMQILVAEDNDVNQLLMVNILKQLGYKANAAFNGKEVLDHLEKEMYDVVFMDVQMPEMDGLEATKNIIHKYGKNGPVVICMTGFTSDDDKRRCFDAGVDDYVTKPVLIEDIQRMIKKWSGNSKSKSAAVKEKEIPLPESNGKLEETLKSFPVLDPGAIQRLRDIAAKTDAAFVNQVITLFEKQVPSGIYEIEEAVTEGDTTKLWQTAHKLKGTCLNVGAKKLAELFRLLEIKGKNGDNREMEQHVHELKPLYERTLLDFRRELSGGS
ncbi:MAG: ATP-binding protein [Bacteroidota bacterium]